MIPAEGKLSCLVNRSDWSYSESRCTKDSFWRLHKAVHWLTASRDMPGAHVHGLMELWTLGAILNFVTWTLTEIVV